MLECDIKVITGNKTLMNWIDRTEGASATGPKGGIAALIKYDFSWESCEFRRMMRAFSGVFVVSDVCFKFENHSVSATRSGKRYW